MNKQHNSNADFPQRRAVEYVRAGLALVPFPQGLKGPTGKEFVGWNERTNCITTEARTRSVIGCSLGLAHAYSDPPTCAIDVDDYQVAKSWLRNQGIDLDALFAARNAVQIQSGRPGHAKLIYRMPYTLRTIQPIRGLEFRCATWDGKTVQDVLPPSIHPDTGKPYKWGGDWRKIPPIPGTLITLWLRLTRSARPSASVSAKQVNNATIADLQYALGAIPADDYHLWIRIGLALASLGDVGRRLWMEWSAKSVKFVEAQAARKWRTFRPQETGYKAVFALGQEQYRWVNPAKCTRKLHQELFDLSKGWEGITEGTDLEDFWHVR